MLKYSASTVEDYIEGNDIEDFDIDELENDRSFMLDVIKKTKDKNFYNLCSVSPHSSDNVSPNWQIWYNPAAIPAPRFRSDRFSAWQ